MAFQAVPALAAGNMPLAGYQVANLKASYAFPDFCNLAHVFMSRCQSYRNRMLRPVVPLIDMYVRSADCRLPDLNLHIVRSYFRNRNTLHPQSFFRLLLHKRPHQSIILFTQFYIPPIPAASPATVYLMSL